MMAKIFAVLLFLLYPIVTLANDKIDIDIDSDIDDEVEEVNNGYYETIGMFGVYGFLDDYTNKSYKDSNIGGGGFLYFNPLNTIYGNLSIGISGDYSQGRLNADNVKANLDIIPASFNVAYMTSSDFVNGWIGAGVSYIFTQIRINEGVVPDSLLSFGHQEKDNKGVIAGDFFAGIEYIFTKNKMFGIFFEFKYTLAQKLKYEKYIQSHNYTLKEDIDLSRMKFTLGISLHF